MSKIFCISYSDFGFLLSEQEWKLTIRKLEGYDYGVFEDELLAGPFVIKRRFLSNLPDIFDDADEKKSEPLLPSDIKRLILERDGTEVYVISSNDFARLFAQSPKDEYGCVQTDESVIDCSIKDSEDLAEDVVLLCACGQDLNCPCDAEV